MPDLPIGNTTAKENIKSAALNHRLSHAVIIEGQEGSGRHTLAKFYSAAALCENPHAPCLSCRNCNLIFRDAHTDVRTFEPDGSTFKVSQVRTIRENAYSKPLEAQRKVFILSAADLMNKQAQNALLKIIEEPPESLIFILICENSESLLPTVRSRCVKFRTILPEINDSVDLLVTTYGHQKDDAQAALSVSGGNIGMALAFLAQDDSTKLLSVAEKIFENFLHNNTLDMLKSFYSLSKKRQETLKVLTFLEKCFFNALKSGVSNGTSSLSPLIASKSLALIKETSKNIKRNGNITLLTTALCAELCAAKSGKN